MKDQQTLAQMGATRFVMNVTGQLERPLKVPTRAFTHHKRLLAAVHFAQARDGKLPPVQGNLEVVLGDAGQVYNQPVRLADVEQIEFELEAAGRNAGGKLADPVAQDKQTLQVALGLVLRSSWYIAFVQLHNGSLARPLLSLCGVCTYALLVRVARRVWTQDLVKVVYR